MTLYLKGISLFELLICSIRNQVDGIKTYLDDQMNVSCNPLFIWDTAKFLSLIFFPSFSLSNQQHLLLGSSQILEEPDEVRFTSADGWPSS